MSEASPPDRPSLRAGLVATAVGGAIGAVARWSLTDTFPTTAHEFPWTVLAINVLGSALLAGVPLLPAVGRHPWLPVFLGTGVLGGFTTMSAASVDTFTLLDNGDIGLGMAYCLGTLAAALLAVLAVDRLTSESQRRTVELADGDE